jgi:uncharacterized damage-inducible protein DinB
MTIETLNTKELFTQLDEITFEFVTLISSVNDKKIDVIPFEDSWTVAQLASHITKSNKAIAQALEMNGEPAKRNADERVEELKKIFLDYTIKFQSPEFILPTQTIYPKKEVIAKLENSVEQLKINRNKTDLTEVINLPAFGEITKFELLNFVVVHTTRHIHQLKKILRSLN